MEKLLLIDNYILFQIDRLSKWLGDWFGIHRFTLARLCINLFALLMIATHTYKLVYQSYPFWTNIIKVVIAIQYYALVKGTIQQEENPEQTELSEGALSLKPLFFSIVRSYTFMWSSIIFYSCGDYSRTFRVLFHIVGFEQELTPQDFISCATIAKQLLVLLALYFVNCFGTPPKKTKVAKIKEKLQGFLQPEPQLAMSRS